MGSFVGLVGYGKGAEVGEDGGRCEEGGEGGGGAEMKFEEGIGYVRKLGHEREGGGDRGVFGGAGEGLQKSEEMEEGKEEDGRDPSECP